MNATVTIFALALASNCHPEQHFQVAQQRILSWGTAAFSPIYVIPCREGIGADYWNSACLLYSTLSLETLLQGLKQIEADSGRIRPSHQISLDVDLIAWGENLDEMQFNTKKLPLPVDVKVPMADVWQHMLFTVVEKMQYKRVDEYFMD